MFRIYKIDVIFNERHFREVWIDPHYEDKHGSYMTDELILILVRGLMPGQRVPHRKSRGFIYYEVDSDLNGKLYRIVFVVPENLSYLGVRAVYRRST